MDKRGNQKLHLHQRVFILFRQVDLVWCSLLHYNNINMIEGMKTRDYLQFYPRKSDTSLPSARIGGMAGIFLLCKNLLMMDLYLFEAVSGLYVFLLIG